jgi:hypothetical protein
MATRRRLPQDFLEENSIEASGKSRVYLGGLAEELHRRNLRSLYYEEKAVQVSTKDKE